MSDPDEALLMARVGELWLKGRNRDHFVRALHDNLQTALSAALSHVQVMAGRGRLYVGVGRAEDVPRALAICADVPGLVDVARVERCPPTLDAIEAAALALVEARWAGATGSFAIDGRRTQKTLPFSSSDLNRRVGAAVLAATGLRVDLSRPDRTLSVEVGPRRAHLWTAACPGAGGLPVGTAGGALLMLSGGIDSPVAGYLAQKRGCRLEAVYFHSPPFVGEATRAKVQALARRLAARQGRLTLHVAPFTDPQLAIRDHCDRRMAVLLYRRMMYRIADRLAGRRGLDALCTGEMLGQVASQTMANLTLVDAVCDRLVLRPLLTHDKQESVALARRIGTYETSILPHDDCCALFLPDHPVTRGTAPLMRGQESRIDVDALVEQAAQGVESVEIEP